jgi:hypothetical protein
MLVHPVDPFVLMYNLVEELEPSVRTYKVPLAAEAVGAPAPDRVPFRIEKEFISKLAPIWLGLVPSLDKVLFIAVVINALFALYCVIAVLSF